MVSRGAKHLILLSRSGAYGAASRQLLEDLESQRISVAAPHVDIGDLGKLKLRVDEARRHMPPIKGCIQATLALRVRVSLI